MSTGMRMDQQDVGGADVVRAFTFNGKRMERGMRLTRDQVLSIPVRNREALVSAQIIREFPIGFVSALERQSDGELFVCRRPDMKFDVVKGVRVNTMPMSSAEAHKMVVEFKKTEEVEALKADKTVFARQEEATAA